MNTTNTSIYANEKARLSALLNSRISGAAEKVSTVAGKGNYVLRVADEGTSVFTRAVFSLAAKKGENKISGDRFLSTATEYLKNPESVKKTIYPTGYNNLKRVSSLLFKKIKEGVILNFVLPEGITDKDMAVIKK